MPGFMDGLTDVSVSPFFLCCGALLLENFKYYVILKINGKNISSATTKNLRRIKEFLLGQGSPICSLGVRFSVAHN